jgi:hypothetical protein
MKRLIFLLSSLVMIVVSVFGQSNPLDPMDFLIGDWSGTGSGFGNEKSRIESRFLWVMNGTYIEVINDSKFDPTDKKPEGENHIDRGFIIYDRIREKIILRQFNSEGYVNQYILSDSLSDDSTLVFETESIENLPNGKARWTIKRISESEYETTFDVSFTGDEYSCMGVNHLKKRPGK